KSKTPIVSQHTPSLVSRTTTSGSPSPSRSVSWKPSESAGGRSQPAPQTRSMRCWKAGGPSRAIGSVGVFGLVCPFSQVSGGVTGARVTVSLPALTPAAWALAAVMSAAVAASARRILAIVRSSAPRSGPDNRGGTLELVAAHHWAGLHGLERARGDALDP